MLPRRHSAAPIPRTLHFPVEVPDGLARVCCRTCCYPDCYVEGRGGGQGVWLCSNFVLLNLRGTRAHSNLTNTRDVSPHVSPPPLLTFLPSTNMVDPRVRCLVVRQHAMQPRCCPTCKLHGITRWVVHPLHSCVPGREQLLSFSASFESDWLIPPTLLRFKSLVSFSRFVMVC